MNTTFAIALAVMAPANQADDHEFQIRGTRSNANSPTAEVKSLPAFFTNRVDQTPDINQNLTYKQLHAQIPASLHAKYTPPAELGGVNARVFLKNFCGPCAASTSLIYLRKWYPLIHPEANDILAGTLLARNLGSNYTDTLNDPTTMTSTTFKDLGQATETLSKEPSST